MSAMGKLFQESWLIRLLQRFWNSRSAWALPNRALSSSMIKHSVFGKQNWKAANCLPTFMTTRYVINRTFLILFVTFISSFRIINLCIFTYNICSTKKCVHKSLHKHMFSNFNCLWVLRQIPLVILRSRRESTLGLWKIRTLIYWFCAWLTVLFCKFASYSPAPSVK